MHIKKRTYVIDKKLLATIISVVVLVLGAFLAYNLAKAKYASSASHNFNLTINREETIKVKFDPRPGHWEDGSQTIVEIEQSGEYWNVPDTNPIGSDTAPYFVIWYFTDKTTGLDANVTKDVKFNPDILPDDMTVHAYYSSTLSLIFDANGGWWDKESSEGVPYKICQTTLDQTPGSKFVKPDSNPINDDIFDYWCLDKEGGDPFDFNKTVSVSTMPNPPIIYAIYKPGDWFRVKFNANDGIDEHSHYWDYPVGTKTTEKEIIEIVGDSFVLPEMVATIGPPLTDNQQTDIALLDWNQNQTIRDPETAISKNTIVTEDHKNKTIYAHYGTSQSHAIHIKVVNDSSDHTYDEECMLKIENTTIQITPSTPYVYEYVDEPWQDPVYYNISTTLSETATVGHASFQRWYVTENVISSEATANVQFARFDLSTQEEGGEFPGWEGYVESEELWLTAHFVGTGDVAYWIANTNSSGVEFKSYDGQIVEKYHVEYFCDNNINNWIYNVDGTKTGDGDDNHIVSLCPIRNNNLSSGGDWAYTSPSTTGLTKKGKPNSNVKKATHINIHDSFVNAPMYSVAFMFDGFGTLDTSSADSLSGINNIPVFNCTSIKKVFNSVKVLRNLDLSDWDTRNITDMESAFDNAWTQVADSILTIRNWDVSKVTRTYRMFYGDNKLSHIYVSPGADWRNIPLATTSSADYMFYSCSSLHNYYSSYYKINKAWQDNSNTPSSNTSGVFECVDYFDIKAEASPSAWGSVNAEGIPAEGIQCDGTYTVDKNKITFKTFDGTSAGSLTAIPADDNYEFLKWTINNEDVVSVANKMIKKDLKIVAWFKSKNDFSLHKVTINFP